MAKNNLRPLRDQILVRRDDGLDQTEAGIIIPDGKEDRPETGVVEAVGVGHRNDYSGKTIKLTVSVGDRVIFNRYAGSPNPVSDEPLLIMVEDDVLAIID